MTGAVQQDRKRRWYEIVQAWATVFATLFTGGAVLVASLSLRTQVAALDDQVAARASAESAAIQTARQINAIHVSWWLAQTINVENGSSVPLDYVFLDTKFHEPHGFGTYIWIGHMDPCTRLTAQWGDPVFADLKDRYSIASLVFKDNQGLWNLNELQQLHVAGNNGAVWPGGKYRDAKWTASKADHCA